MNSNPSYLQAIKSKDLAKDTEFISLLSDKLEKKGGAKAGPRKAFFFMGGERYIYQAHSIHLPERFVCCDDDAASVFAGLIYPLYSDANGPQHIRIRIMDITEKDGNYCFYIRSAKVLLDKDGEVNQNEPSEAGD